MTVHPACLDPAPPYCPPFHSELAPIGVADAAEAAPVSPTEQAALDTETEDTKETIAEGAAEEGYVTPDIPLVASNSTG